MQTFDGAGTMYIVDTFNQVIRRVGRDGVITTIAGKAGGYVPRKDSDCKENFSGENVPAREATMSCPHSAAVAANGDLYIADSANHVIRKVDHASGIITTVVGEGGKTGDDGDGGPATAAHIDGPKGIVFDANWNLLIADSGNDKIRRVDAVTGVITTIAGTGETAASPATAGRPRPPSSANPARWPSPPTVRSTSPSRRRTSSARSTRRASSRSSPAPARPASPATAARRPRRS